MEGNRRSSFKKRPNPHNKQGGGNKRGKFSEQSFESSHVSETSYRILCPIGKIGSVIGKGGGIIKALREETQAKISVAETVPGSEERVITVSSPSAMLPVQNNNELELYCAAQDAFLKIHDKIVAEDLIGVDENDEGIVVTARMLVPNNTVGCVLGKKGDVIQRLRSETGASIRVLPTDQLPTCALSTDELVQISAIPAIAKKALHEVTTLLHHNPRKDKPPSTFHIGGGHGSHHSGPTMETIPPMNFMRPDRGSNARGAQPLPWMGMYSNDSPRFGNDGFNGDHAGEDTPVEFSMKVLCSAAKIGGIIGKGGANVRQLQQETRTSIHVDEPSAEADERVICVSSFEVLRNPRSQTIDAVLYLQDKISEPNEKGLITSRLLIPSNKVGCIIGQGGQVINEMRRRTRADIRVYSKEEKPKCAAEDDELVQVCGSYGVAKDALGEIASRYRARCFRDAKPGTEPPPAPLPGFMPRGSLGLPPTSGIRGGGYATFKGAGREYESNYLAPPPTEYDPYAYPFPPPPSRAPGYPGLVDVKMPTSGPVSGMATGVHNVSEVLGARLKPQDPYAVGAEPVPEMHGSSQPMNPSDAYHGYGGPGGPNHPHPVPYGTQQGPYPDSHTSYHGPTSATTTSTHPLYPPPQQGHYPEPPPYPYGP